MIGSRSGQDCKIIYVQKADEAAKDADARMKLEFIKSGALISSIGFVHHDAIRIPPEPWHSPQTSPSPSANVVHEDGFSNFRAAASDA